MPRSHEPNTDPTTDEALNGVLRELIAGAREALGENFVAAYLQGSFAVGDWDVDSDVDFLIATERDAINDLFREGKLKDEARRRIERELDLREAHLANQKGEE